MAKTSKKKCQWHEGGFGRPICGKEAVAKAFGAYVCQEHADSAKKKWGSEHIKPLRRSRVHGK